MIREEKANGAKLYRIILRVAIVSLQWFGSQSAYAINNSCGGLFKMESSVHKISDPDPGKSYGYNAFRFHIEELEKDLALVRSFSTVISPSELWKARKNFQELEKKKSKLNSKGQVVDYSPFKDILQIGEEIYSLMVKQDTRLKLFYLQADASNYKGFDEKFEVIKQVFQALENHIGQVDLRKSLLAKAREFGFNENKDSALFSYHQQEINSALIELVLALNGMPLYKYTAEETAMIEVKKRNIEEAGIDWGTSQSSYALLKEIDKIFKSGWGKEKKARKKERNYLLANLVEDIRKLSEKVTKGDFINDNIELGLHELRRKLRGLFSLRMTALHGLVTPVDIDLIEEYKDLDTSGINPKYVSTFPVYGKDRHLIYYPRSLYLKMMLLTLGIGNVKEQNEFYEHYVREFLEMGQFPNEQEARRYVQGQMVQNGLSFVNHKAFTQTLVDELLSTGILDKFADFLERQRTDIKEDSSK